MTAPRDGMVFTSIEYDDGWTVLVDGKKAETFAAGNAMLSFDVTAGEHTVTINFFPRGFAIGLALSAIGLILLVLIVWGLRHPDKVQAIRARLSRKKEPVEADMTELTEPTEDSAVAQMEKWLDEQTAEPLEEPQEEA